MVLFFILGVQFGYFLWTVLKTQSVSDFSHMSLIIVTYSHIVEFIFHKFPTLRICLDIQFNIIIVIMTITLDTENKMTST